MVDMNDPVIAAIVQARVYLLINHAFFGNLATRLELVDATKWCPTAATDGRKFYYNREFIKKLTRQELVFLVGHEILHCVYDHIGRRSSRDPQVWNMANDYIVNYTLVKERIGDMIKGGLFSEKYTDELTSEEVYEMLKQNSVQIQMTIDMHLEANGDGDGDGDGDKDGNGNGKKTVTVSVTGEDGPPKLTEADLNEIRNEVRAAVISAAQQIAGKVPAGILRLIKDITEPKMDWRELLEMQIKSSIRDDYTFRRLSRRTWSTGCILPGQADSETIDIEVFIDVSGSISDEMVRDFLGEVKGIMDMFPEFRLGVATFDTRVYNYKVFTRDNAEEILGYQIKGGGGTAFEAVFQFMEDNDIEPNTMVMFTDGYPCGTWGPEGFCDTLFIIHGSESIVPPWGSYAYYTDHRAKRRKA